MNKFSNKQLWYLATVCGFAIGLATGWWFLGICKPSDPWTASWMELFFWVFPAAGAGLGMGSAQWILIRRIHKNAWLWILSTAIGVIVISGGTLLALIVTGSYQPGNLSRLFSQLPSWFIPLTVVTPIIIFIDPFSQWLVVRQVTKNQSFKELLKLSAGWILAILVLFIILGLTGTLVQSRNYIIISLAIIMFSTPSGLIFAYSTIGIIEKPQSGTL
jgi:hypothetical protein